MRLPSGERAIIESGKLEEYLLAPEHPRGQHKARLFAVLGYTRANADALRAELLFLARNCDVAETPGKRPWYHIRRGR